MLSTRSPSQPTTRPPTTWRDLKTSQTGRAVGVALLFIGCVFLVLRAGSAHFALVHAYYFPVLLAAHWFRLTGGVIAGIVAGILASPYVVAIAIPLGQGDLAWVYRMAFFTAVGVFAGAARKLMEARKQRVEDTLKDLTSTYTRTLQALVRLLEHHDEETSRHCERVAHNARQVGKRLGLSRRELETLYWAGYMHDIGKLASPAKMLLKSGALTGEEYEVMKQHAAIGADTILAITPAFRELAEAIRAHHERWDGAGYPLGQNGNDIPLLGRILTVVDSFEAMTSDRPYRKAMNVHEAREILLRESWQQFDGTIVKNFVELLTEGAIHIEKTHPKQTTGGPREISPEFLLGTRSDGSEEMATAEVTAAKSN